MSAVEARFASRCPECGQTIEIGAPIAPGRDFLAPWVHETCPPGKLDIIREVCPECFTERSVDGSCLCGAV